MRHNAGTTTGMPNRPTLLTQVATVRPTFRSKLAAFLRGESERQGLTRTEVAKLAGMSAKTLGRTLRGRRTVTLPELAALATALDVSATALFEQGWDGSSEKLRHYGAQSA